MSNATELLNFFQVKVEAMEKEWEFEGAGDSLVQLWSLKEMQQTFGGLHPEVRADTKSLINRNDCFFKAPGDPLLTADMDTCSEALAQLDDVIMHTFQQCVYHLTKVQHKKQDKNCVPNPC